MNKGKNRIRLIAKFILLSAYISMTLYECDGRENQKKQEDTVILEKQEDTVLGKKQVLLAFGKKNARKGEDGTVGGKGPPGIDYKALKEAGYEILYKNITKKSEDIYEDNWLMEQLAYVFEADERMRELSETTDEYVFIPTNIEYFLFDFNGDGEDEYFVLLHGLYWGGRYETGITILKRTGDGGSEELYSAAGEFAAMPGRYPLAVLNDRVGGYYSFVLPWTDVIWKYNEETGTYSDAYHFRE